MTAPPMQPIPGNGGRSSWLAAPAFLVLLAVVLPLILGQQTLFFRDVFNSHLPMKQAQAEAFRAGYLPLVDPHRGGGQPAVGNLNGVPLYPDNLLYLWAEPLWAMNAHFWLHLLLAPVAMFALGRVFGLGVPASWVAGFAYGTSGWFLSHLNLYNLVAGGALAPLLVTTALLATDPRRARGERRLGAVGLGVLWAAMIVAGDPTYALLALVLAATAIAVRHGRAVSGLAAAVLGLGAGTLCAAPQWIELLRIVELSYRGHRGYSVTSSLMASWDPRTLLEWFLPLAFGRPALDFWGSRFFDTEVPLFLSLSPGLLVLALVAVSGLGLRCGEHRRLRLFAWASLLLGVGLALGSFNPLVRLLAELPGGQLLRFPVKLWLAAAFGLALLAGLGLERSQSGRRHADPLRALVVLAVLYLLLGLFLVAFGGGFERWLSGQMPTSMPDRLPRLERLRWLGLVRLSLLGAALLGLASWLGRRRRRLGTSLLLLVHVGLQVTFLQTLLATDATSAYVEPPPVAESLGPGLLLVHGGLDPHPFPGGSQPSYPDPSLHWVQRLGQAELHPFAGIPLGLRYDLNPSPEGLDSFLTLVAGAALPQLADDGQRLRLLQALGIDALLISRPLDEWGRRSARLLHRERNFGAGLWLYAVSGEADEVQWVGDVRPAATINEAVEAIVAPDFSPRRAAVVAGTGERLTGGLGGVEVLARGPESLRVIAESESPGLLVWQRSHLPLYRATVDGVPVPTTVANLTRVAVRLPAGRHEVEIRADRGPTRMAWGIALLGVALLVLLAVRGRRESVVAVD